MCLCGLYSLFQMLYCTSLHIQFALNSDVHAHIPVVFFELIFHFAMCSEQGPTSSIRRVRWQNNSTLSIDPPVTLLNGSLDFASAYLFSSMDTMCLLGDNITGNISILPGNILSMSPHV